MIFADSKMTETPSERAISPRGGTDFDDGDVPLEFENRTLSDTNF